MLAFAATVFVSAFLLFQVQPLVGKVVLPWFGGTPNVWATCVLFFQLVLLAGYAYAHVLRRFRPATQAKVHFVVLAVGLAFAALGILPAERWKPTGAETTPALSILLLLGASVGVPYFVVSTTGPLVQSWFAALRPGQSPYRLYSLSNVGSLLALATFPIYFERQFAARTLAWMWSGGFLLFALLCGYLAWRLRADDPAPLPAPPPSEDPPPGAGQILLWLGLAACGSMLLVAGTNQLANDIAMVPFLYVLPLALYLLSFILCFDSNWWYWRWVGGLALVAAAGGLALVKAGPDADMGTQLIGYNLAIFLGCMACHGELARRKPAPARLTLFFLIVSLGGVLGGALVSLVAPNVFDDLYDFPLALAATAALFGLSAASELRFPARSHVLALGGLLAGAYLLAPTWFGPAAAKALTEWSLPLLGASLMLAALYSATPGARGVGAGLYALAGLGFAGFALSFTGGRAAKAHAENEWMGRNFFGTLNVHRYYAGTDDEARWLHHGRIEHGMQYLKNDLKTQPTHYFVEASGLGTAITRHPRRVANESLRVGVIGLGTGMIATYAKPGDFMLYYDINPMVDVVARKYFTYLEDSAAKPETLLGDARIVLERQLREGQPQQFDVLVVDAFSSDAIPTHLLTKECFEMYLQHLRNPDEGIVVLHVSNRFLALERIGRALARELELEAVSIETKGEEHEGPKSQVSSWVLLTRNQKFLADDTVKKRRRLWHDEVPPWHVRNYRNDWDLKPEVEAKEEFIKRGGEPPAKTLRDALANARAREAALKTAAADAKRAADAAPGNAAAAEALRRADALLGEAAEEAKQAAADLEWDDKERSYQLPLKTVWTDDYTNLFDVVDHGTIDRQWKASRQQLGKRWDAFWAGKPQPAAADDD